MTDNPLLSLRASPKTDTQKDSLPFIISRINEQRGSFRNVTEDSLREEIQAQEAGRAETIEESGDLDEVQDAKPRREQLATAREDMLRHVNQAYNESAQALDFISLLISRHAPQQAEKTINPYIKNTLPLGVLGTDAMQSPQQTDAQEHSERLVSVGWKMQSLNSVADSLLNSATRLENEMERETKYWEKVLAVKEHGWSICRLPKEKHTLGVKYGFNEGGLPVDRYSARALTVFPAYADFRDRGMAALRRDGDGGVSLDRGTRASDQVLRVRITQKGRVLGSSCLSDSSPVKNEDNIKDMPIERQILQARNSIFDDELHAECHREARNLVNQGVRCSGNVIQLPYEADKQIEIDLVDHEQDLIEASDDDRDIATATGIVLRILLSHAHRQNHHRRSQPPPPITDGKRPRPIYAILKPIVENNRHRSDVQSTKHFLAELTVSLRRAKLSFDTTQTATPIHIPPDLSIFKKDEPPLTDLLLNALTSPLHTSINLDLPSGQISLKIDVFTNLFAPTLGTEFRTTITSHAPDAIIASIPPSMQFTTCNELEEHIIHILVLDLVSVIDASDKRWEIVNPHTGSLSKSGRDSEGKLQITSLRAFFENRKLGLEWQRKKEGVEGVQQGLESWKGGDEGGRGFMDVVKGLAEGAG